MPRFVRAEHGHEGDEPVPTHRAEHPDLVHLVQAYSSPMVPDPDSSLSVRDQHLRGIVRPRRVRDPAWRPLD
jgi:hypothetical protein